MVRSILPSRLKRTNSANGTPRSLSPLPPKSDGMAATLKDLGLVLKVVILRARDLAAKDRSGTSDPYLVLSLGDYRVATHSVPKTLNPEWNVIESLPVSSVQSLLLEVIAWDKDRFGKDYLGEFDVALEEVFGGQAKTSLEPLWFPLQSKRPGKKTGVVSGEVLLQFTLLDTVSPGATQQQVLDKLGQLAASASASGSASGSGSTPRDLTPTATPSVSPSRMPKPAALPAGDDEDGDDLDEDEDDDDGVGGEEEAKQERRRRRLRIRGLRRKKRLNPYEFTSGGSDVVGIIFLEICAITDLPPESNVTRTGFDMDPFVVVSLGKKTYRTRHVRHNLNPVFNEKMIFQVVRHEQAYSFAFTVIDHDKYSGNDFVASCSLPLKELIDRAPKASPDTGLYELPDVPPECSKAALSASTSSRPRSLLKLGLSRSASVQSVGKGTRPPLTKQPSATSSATAATAAAAAAGGSTEPSATGAEPTVPAPEPAAAAAAAAVAPPTSNMGTNAITNSNINSSINNVAATASAPAAGPAESTDAAATAAAAPAGAAAPPADCDEWGFAEFAVPLKMKNQGKWEAKHSPVLYLRAKYMPYAALRQQFWRSMLKQYDTDETGMISKVELTTMLDTLGSTLRESTIDSFYHRFPHRSANSDGSWEIEMDEAVICLEDQLETRSRSSGQQPARSTSGGSASSRVLPSPGQGSDSMASQPSLSEALAPAVAGASSSERSQGSMSTIAVPELHAPDDDGGSLMFGGGSGGGAGCGCVEEPDRIGPEDMMMNDDRAGGGSGEEEEHVVEIRECPICHMPRLNKRNDADIVTHIATCASQDWRRVNTLMMGGFVTASQAQRKWYSKVFTKIGYGGYRIGANSANILIQDRLTGQINEEKMSVYVRLGIRLLYKGLKSKDMENKRIRRLLKSLSIKQGRKFDDPASRDEIPKFIQFHRLDMSEVLQPVDAFRNFNEFFYRALKPDARPCSAPDQPRVIVSPADCRSVVFNSVDQATRIWVKGREFSVRRLLGDAYPEDAARYERGSLGIFRLAPQDYHRFHIPVDGVMGQPRTIEGEYYTVNPMAIRSALDVYGENVRVLVPIDSAAHGRVMVVCVGAMMVGSTIITRREGEQVSRAEELGYFKFGGSTIVLLFEEGRMRFDSDLVDNSTGALETLIRAGMSIGHSPDQAQWAPDMRKEASEVTDADRAEAKRRIQGNMSTDPSPEASGDERTIKEPVGGDVLAP